MIASYLLALMLLVFGLNKFLALIRYRAAYRGLLKPAGEVGAG